MACVIFGRFPVVHRIEIGTRIVSLDGLEETLENILETTSSQRPAVQQTVVKRTTSGRFSTGTPLRPFRFSQPHPWVVARTSEYVASREGWKERSTTTETAPRAVHVSSACPIDA